MEGDGLMVPEQARSSIVPRLIKRGGNNGIGGIGSNGNDRNGKGDAAAVATAAAAATAAGVAASSGTFLQKRLAMTMMARITGADTAANAAAITGADTAANAHAHKLAANAAADAAGADDYDTSNNGGFYDGHNP